MVSNGKRVAVPPVSPGGSAKRLATAACSATQAHTTKTPGLELRSPSEWQETMQRTVRSVVSVHFSSVCPFDTESTYVSEATGFVVDARQGIIMTNRHVVGPGPFRGFAIFDNHEETDVSPIYRDPVHDFGFLKFNPEAIKHMTVGDLSLRPEHAHVGAEIRVVGNDAGEKLSILAGFISRLDRNAPEYGDLTYNDFNTEYIQAAASASGGSSGSPVVDINGDVLALQAGGSSIASTDFFFPLYRGARALDCIQSGKQVSRGSIQCQWLLKPFDECMRLGLSADSAGEMRKHFPENIGLLVAETVLPEGPAASAGIEEGDCLISVAGQRIGRFRDLEAILDDNVGKNLELLVQRGGTDVALSVSVQDLHSITPSRFVRVAGAVFNDLSYQIARLYAMPTRGVYIAHTGLYFRPDHDTTGWLIEELDHRPTPNLDTFIEVVQSIPDTKKVAAKFRHVTDRSTVITSVVDMDRHWFPDLEIAERNDKTGLWDFRTVGKALPSVEPERKQKARFAPLATLNEGPCAKIVRAIVKVSMTSPIPLEGFPLTDVSQYGFVIDAQRGMVLVSRMCVPHYLVDVSVTIAESVIVPAKVLFLHPQQNYAILQYDPNLVDAPIESICLNREHVKQGQNLIFIGYDSKANALVTDTKVMDVSSAQIPSGFDVPPRYRATNIDAVGVDSSLLTDLSSGLLADPHDGSVRAIWMSFMGDVVASTGHDRVFRLAVDAADFHLDLREYRFVDVEVRGITIAAARIRGVPIHWLEAVQSAGGTRPLEVQRVTSWLQGSIIEGDLIMAINGKVVTSGTQLFNLESPEVELTLIRRGEEKKVSVPTKQSEDTKTRTVVYWSGMIVHEPHHAVLQQVKNPPKGVYVGSVIRGSPANQYGLWSTSFVTHVNGAATSTIDDFYNAVRVVPDNTYAKLRTVSCEGIVTACSVRANYHYFPTWRKDLVDGKWVDSEFLSEDESAAKPPAQIQQAQ